MPKPLLQVQNTTVSFEGFKALDNVSWQIMPKTIEVVIGPNGAGKSTLMDMIIGRVRPIAGHVIFNGEDITHLPEYEIVRRGICRKFQIPGILPTLTVEENLIIAAKRNRNWFSSFKHSISVQEKNRIEEVLHTIALEDERNKQAVHLAHGAKQWLEIGMVIAADGELILLDEPAAGMTHQERESTAMLIKKLGQYHAFMVIDHDMDFVEQLAAPVSVLHMGRLLRQGSIEEVRHDPEVRAIYLGREGDTDHA